MTDDPLILTLELDPDSFAWLDALRQQHFPPERNYLAAHLTLFHKLDAAQVACMKAVMHDEPSFALHFSALRFLGGGVAIDVASESLQALRAKLAASASGDLTPQDRQGFRPHVTIQNKVAASVARALMEDLQRHFVPREGRGTALLVWRYLGGPWELYERLPFT